jgi:hypothetical protein
MLIKHDSHASAAGHKWEPGDEVEVDEALAAELIAIQDGGFYNPDDGPDKPQPHRAYLEAMEARNLGPQTDHHGQTRRSPFLGEEDDDVEPEDLHPARPFTTPPEVGKGSGTLAWRLYAESLGIEIPAQADRTAIIYAVKEYIAEKTGEKMPGQEKVHTDDGDDLNGEEDDDVEPGEKDDGQKKE